MKVSTLHVQGLLEGLRLCGHDAAGFATHAELAPQLVEGAIGWIDELEFERLSVLALDFTGDEAFGLHWGNAPFVQFDLGRTAAYSDSLLAALQRLAEFQRLLASRPEMVLDVVDQVATLTVHPLAISKRARRMRHEFASTAVLRLFEHFGVRDAISSIDFAHSAPEHVREYHRVLRLPVRFDQPRTCLTIPREALQTANSAPNRIMLSGLRGLAETLLPRPDAEQGIVNRLGLLISAAWPTPPRINEAARLLQVSERTLRRSLEREGESYSKLVQVAQIRRAEQLLLGSSLSVKEIAAEVGFQSATAFQRAFKRHTGLSPLSFRAERSS